MAINVVRYKRNKLIGDSSSPELYYLKQAPGTARTRSLESLARDIELIGSMSTDDILHVMRAFTRRLKIALTEGYRVKIDGLGIFYLSFNSTGTEEEKDCTVKNIQKVNIRFRTDSTLRLVNDSTATTRGGENNVKFVIKGESAGGSSGGNGSGDDDDDDWEDPNA